MFLLFISLFISFLNAFISYISSAVLLLVKNDTSEDSIKKEIAELKEQMSEISIVDEFAKYALLERKVNKLNNQLKQEMRDKIVRKLMVNTTITYSLQAVIILASVIVFWTYRWTPIVILPSEWLGPFSSAVSWPTGEAGAIGFPIWFLACNSFAKLLAKPFV